MNIKPLIVKSYLESLTEESELNRIFPILLTSLNFDILSKPTENKGLQEFGKDIIAVGKDVFVDKDDVGYGKKKRFYFELKGGADRDVSKATFYKEYGIFQSLTEAKLVDFKSDYQDFDSLPKKIVLVHNGILKGNIRDVYDGFLKQEFPKDGVNEYDRWDIEKLTELFTDNLFGAFLLTDVKTTNLFNKVLINLNASNHVSSDFIDLLDALFEKEKWEGYKTKLNRKWEMLFETLKLISFIVYTEAKEYNNFDLSKRYLTHLIIRYWYWILKNKLETDKKVLGYFTQTLDFYRSVLTEYFQRTLGIAVINNGLSSESSGRYEQIGYTKRTFEYLQYLCLMLSSIEGDDLDHKQSIKEVIIKVLNANSVSMRPLLDVNSIPIIDVINLLVFAGDKASAINYLKGVIFYIKNGKEKYGRLPDANNSYKSVIRFTLTHEKPVYYSDSTSPLLAVIMEYIAIFELEEEYYDVRKFLIENKIDIGIFTPHHGIYSTSKNLIENNEDDLEEQLFSNPHFNDGYQHDISLFEDLNKDLSFEKFKEEFAKRKDEFQYEYRTDKAGLSFLKDLAHIYFQTPYFPDKWREIELENCL
ncbi:hypothetical protein GQR60_11505 [Labilibaculum sp. A4]|uniref:hypothetical protein n=1 Tax=Labilibaculum euxinus TaxID=2686357 RepID=UPI000F61FCB8|nr:hypothetical protein [Labilibaculum euxinus]MDQ1771021.1 hypothetical protein [Labilibaculum euxinus]MWN76968.1 hypothetical protein [Labilibaculum euxinus]